MHETCTHDPKGHWQAQNIPGRKDAQVCDACGTIREDAQPAPAPAPPRKRRGKVAR